MHRHYSRHLFCIAHRCLFLIAVWLMASTAYAQPTFSKTFGPDTIGPGSQTTLSFFISNGSNTPAIDMAFTDMLPAGMTIATPPATFTDCVNGLINAPAGGNTISFTEGRLSAFEDCVVRVNVTSNVFGVLTNISGDLTSSLGNSGTATDDLTVESDRPGFSKSFSPSTVNFRERSTLTFTIDNTINGGNVFSMSFGDEFPIGMVVADPANVSNTCGGGFLDAQPGADNINYSPQFPGDATVAAGVACTVSVDVMGNATGPLGNVSGDLLAVSLPSPFQNSSGLAGDTLQVNVDEELVFSKSFTDDPVLPGGVVNLEFRIQNPDRNFGVTNIAFTDDLNAVLAGLTAVGLPLDDVCGPGSQINGGTSLTFTGGSLGPDSFCTFSVSLQTPAGAVVGGYVNTTSQITGDVAGNPVVGNTATETLFIGEAPQLSKTFLTNPVGAGETVSMEFSITNVSATSAATDITFNDSIDTFLPGAVISSLPASGFCGAGSTLFTFFNNGTLFLSMIGGNLAPAASCTFSVDLLVPIGGTGGVFTNTTTPISATVDGFTQTGFAATADLEVLEAPSLEKTFTDDPVAPGDTVTLEFTLSHDFTAPADATGITFTDDLNAVLTGLAAIGLPANDVCGTGSQISGTTNLSFTGGILSPGESCTFSVTLQVPAAALPGVFTNVTSNLTAMVSGETVTGSSDSDELTITGLQFSKEFIDDPVIAGQTATLRFTIDNTSTVNDATGMFFTDSLSTTLSGLAAVAPLPTDPCGPGSSISGTTFLIFVGGNLTPGTSCSFDVTVQVPPGAQDDTYQNLTSSLTATIDGSVTVLPAASDTLTVNSNQLMLSKSFTDDPVPVGDTVTLEFMLTNLSATDSVSDVAFTDDLNAVIPGLTAIGLPATDICGAGSTLSGAGLLTFTGGTLPPSGSCTFSVTLQVPAASSPGVFVNTTSSLTGTLGGLAVTGDPAIDNLTVLNFDFSKSFVNPVVTGNNTTLTFTIQNNGDNLIDSISFSDDLNAVVTGMTALGLPVSAVCGESSVLSGTDVIVMTGASLASGASCNFDVVVNVPLAAPVGTFINTTSELFASGLTIAAPATADIMVMGIPELTVTPPLTEFGDQLLGSTSGNLQVMLENTGTDVLDVTSITFAAAPFNFVGSSCAGLPFSLAVGASCTVDYSFSPTVLGMASQVFTLENNGITSPNTFTLQGNGVQSAISIAPTLIDFGDQLINTTSGVMSASLENTGTADLNVTSITAAAAPFALAGGSCSGTPIVLAPGNNCSLDFTFSPTATGAAMQALSVVSDAPTTPDTLTLQGNGTQAGLGLSTSMPDFGDVNLSTTAVLPLIVTNTGDGPLTVTAIDDPLAPFALALGTCGGLPFTLQPAAACQVDLSFTPAVLGNANATFDITSNAPTSPDTVSLTGNGVQPQLALDVSDLDFDIVIVGANKSLPLTLSNAGDGDLSITDITDPLMPFEVFEGTCGALPIVLMAAQQCQLDINFRPRNGGEFSSAFDIVSNSTDSPATVNLTGIGLLVEVPTLSRWSLITLIITVLLVSAFSLRRSTAKQLQ